MRRAARRDDNEAEIVAALRKVGASVHHVSSDGAPDLLVGRHGKTYLVEVKHPKKGALKPAQVAFRDSWKGEQVYIVRDADEALLVLNCGDGKICKCGEVAVFAKEWSFDAGCCGLCADTKEAK